ncbi:unnamed protein product [Clonostachys solani]|uniref:Uncharacterized protein n=1 Tax=Clonostachys solani TaxID=160281 RepID=A0A9N9ZAG4_9HYPO|nr:unnamed protein product [Clonostachys solani]
MDPFQKLPVEIQLKILVLTNDLDLCSSLSRASPTMSKVYSNHLDYIERKHNENILINDYSLIEDIMAVILFPEADVTKCIPEERVTAVEKHLHAWGAKQLPNPFLRLHSDEERISLVVLFGPISLYVEDCLGKANGARVRRSYRRFPSWAHPDFSQGFSQRQFDDEECSFDLKTLSVDERRRIFAAFIRYELICKIYGPRTGAKVPVGGIHPPCCHSRMQQLDGDIGDKFDAMMENHWKQDHLETSINSGDNDSDVIIDYTFEQLAPDPFRCWDWQTPRESSLLGCVREYVLTCYGALISEVLKAPLPKWWETQIYENAPKLRARRFWDSPNCWTQCTDWGDMGELGYGWSDLPFSFMASCGFDLLTNTLLSSIADFRELLCRQLVHDLLYCEGTSVHTNVDYEEDMYQFEEDMYQFEEDMYESMWDADWYPHDLRRLYRQRAWVLFDNPRPQNLRLPTVAEYCSIHTCHNLNRPHEEVETEECDELICHAGGYAAYPALQTRLVRCWTWQNGN